MSTRILLVDDEALARTRIREFIKGAYPGFEMIEARDGFEALEKIPSFLPEIIFLDIEMPELSGFDVLHQVEHRKFHVIFQTAYDEFAIKAFEANACDYLLKPFSDERLRQAIERALSRPADSTELQRLETHLISSHRYLDRIAVAIGPERRKLIDCSEILAFVSESHMTKVILEKGDYIYNYPLKFLEERLDPSRFMRIHRNAILSLKAVTSFRAVGHFTVTLKNGMELKVSRDKRNKLRSVLEHG